MTLRRQVIDLIRLHLLNNPDQVGRIGQVAIMQKEVDILLVLVVVQMINTIGIKR